MTPLLLMLLACGAAESPCDAPVSLVGTVDSDELAAFCAADCAVDVAGDALLWMDGADLSCLRTVDGDVRLLDRGGGRYDGPAGLTRIGGDLRLSSQRQVTVLGGFDALVQVDGSVYLVGASSLTTLDGFGALADIGGDLRVSQASQLATAAPLGLERVGGQVEIGSAALTDLRLLDGLPGSGDLMVWDMPWLTSLDGLSDLDWARTTVDLRQLPQLRDISALSGATALSVMSMTDVGVTDLSPLSDVTDAIALQLAGMPMTSLDGLGSLQHVTLDLVIFANPYLADISALSGSLQSVGGSLNLGYNDALACTDIDALIAGIEVGGQIESGECHDDDDDSDTGPDPDDTGIDPDDTGVDPG
ncbi:MAG: hypothetical protein H6742_03290 [Alphaproteobacteria bacterium]|nr:hypothetical protein [Alphaproteobacteria bacterium]